MPWDPYEDFRVLDYCTKAFMSLWHSYKPTIAKVHGYGIAGGSDIALCADMVIMAEDAKIGYPPARFVFARGPLIHFFLQILFLELGH